MLAAIERYNADGLSVIVVSNRTDLSKEDIEKLCSLCHSVLLRPNIGYDFGAYRDGVLWILDRYNPRLLIIANDSVFRPMSSLALLLATIENETKATVFGLSDSHEITYHFQSYWLGFNSPALALPALRRFWRRMPYRSSKARVILGGETRLLSNLCTAGLAFHCFYPVAPHLPKAYAYWRRENWNSSDGKGDPRLLNEFLTRGLQLNPSIHLWDYWLNETDFPFLKRQVCQLKGESLRVWERLPALVALKSYDIRLVEEGLSQPKI